MKHERNPITSECLNNWSIGFPKSWNIVISVAELIKAGFKRKYEGATQVVIGTCVARY